LNITNRFQDIGFTFIASVVSRIRWTAVPKEASGIYQCRDSNDVSQSTSNATLIVISSKQFLFVVFLCFSYLNLRCMFSSFEHGRIQDQENKINTFSRADRLSICRALIVRRSAKWNGWDCKQWRMMRTTTEKKLNVSISLK
jgi:hypothetical protein